MGGIEKWGISRRDFLRAAGTLGVSGGLLGAYAGRARGHNGEDHGPDLAQAATEHNSSHGGNSTVGGVDTSRFDPSEFLRDFYWGEHRREGGRTVREYELTAEDLEIEVAPRVFYPAWAYNGQVPGPTLMATEGERLRVVFKNRGAHPHTIHFHGFHPANMDGVFELVGPGQEFVYEFDAEPFGCHLYRFDTNFDGANEVYAVNTVAFHHQKHPVKIKKGELVRVYVVNVLEFDLINSFHTHANFF